MKNQKFGIEIEMTAITRSQAAIVIAEYFSTEYSHVGGSYGIDESISDNEAVQLIDIEMSKPPEPPVVDIPIESVKSTAVAKTKQWVENELDKGMPYERDGEIKMYTITREKQSLLMGQLITGSMLKEQGVPSDKIILKWNASGEEHTDWTLTELSAFAFAVTQEQIIGVISAVSVLAAYIIGEGLTDAANSGKGDNKDEK